MRFEEAYTSWQDTRLTQEEAARLLGVCERTFPRYIDRFEEAGLGGLIDRRVEEEGHPAAGCVDPCHPLDTLKPGGGSADC